MDRKLIGFCCLILAACLAAAAPAGARDKGFELIDKYIMMFKELAETGAGGPEKVHPALDGIMNETIQGYGQKSIDPVFNHRFRRLLMITKFITLKDKAGILAPVVERELGRFVEEVKGEAPLPVDGKSGIGINVVADAIAEELINLQILLDGKKDRERLKREFMENFQAGPGK